LPEQALEQPPTAAHEINVKPALLHDASQACASGEGGAHGSAGPL
jgi:hypothetical protein